MNERIGGWFATLPPTRRNGDGGARRRHGTMYQCGMARALRGETTIDEVMRVTRMD